jgi:hypothetical protein
VKDLINPSKYLIYLQGRSIDLAGSLPPLRWGFREIFSSGARIRAGTPVALMRLGFSRLWAHPFSSLALVTVSTVQNPLSGHPSNCTSILDHWALLTRN